MHSIYAMGCLCTRDNERTDGREGVVIEEGTDEASEWVNFLKQVNKNHMHKQPERLHYISCKKMFVCYSDIHEA